jgi:hypothetical protein
LQQVFWIDNVSLHIIARDDSFVSEEHN